MEVTIDLKRLPLVGGAARATVESWTVTSPATGDAVGTIGVADAALMAHAIDAAAAAMREAPPAYARAEALERLATALELRAEEMAALLTAEAGKPIRHARTEVSRAVSTLRLSAVEARTLTGHTIPMDGTAAGSGRLAFTVRVPVGVVAAITPFNFPLNLACHKIGPAIAAGCPVVLKPADKAPLAAGLLVELAMGVGLPDGWVNLVVGDPATFARLVSEDPRVGLITFTGSSEIGWSLRALAARKAVTLELGNVTPVIVDETAPVAEVAERLALSAFAFAGQSCISTQRVYVHEEAAPELESALAEAARSIRVGDPEDPATDVGPLITDAAADRVVAMIDQARAEGAQVLAGGARSSGRFVEPTVLAGAPDGADVLTREAFGPVVVVQRYSRFSEAIERANATDFGLQAGLFTTQLDRVLVATQGLEFAGVTVNEVPTFRADQMPYGGVKASGNTREGPAYAVREMTEERLITLQPA
jgi:acyl-CoA reductase-like NAD-dependent aldehyde dehydrogenase